MMNMAWTTLIGLLVSQKVLLIQCIVFLILNVFDGITTWLVMKPDHYERERNPFARWVFRRLKAPGGIVLFKSVLLGGLGVFIAYWWREALTINIGLLVGNILYIIVVLHNRKVFLQYKEQDEQLQQILNHRIFSE